MTVTKKDRISEKGKVFKPHEKQSEVLYAHERFVAAIAGWSGGKCNRKSFTKLHLRQKGLTKIEDVEVGDEVLSISPEGKIEYKRVLQNVNQGTKDVYRLTTKSGRQTDVTIDHPFLTPSGEWKPLNEIDVWLAIPHKLPIDGTIVPNTNDVKFMAYYVTEGCKSGNTVVLCNADKDIVKEFYEIIDSDYSYYADGNCHYTITHNRKRDNKYRDKLKEWGMWGKYSYEKILPPEVFLWNNKFITLLINRMFACDGWVDTRGVGYCTTSEELARQLQHLLLRLGIFSRLRRKEAGYNGKRCKDAFYITINEREMLHKFSKNIGIFIKQKKLEALLKTKSTENFGKGMADPIPFNPTSLLNSMDKERASYGVKIAGHAYRYVDITGYELIRKYKSGSITTRYAIKELADHFNSDYLKFLSSDNIYWDKVKSVDYMGKDEVYDLEVEDNHNYIANDIFLHNCVRKGTLIQLATGEKKKVEDVVRGDVVLSLGPGHSIVPAVVNHLVDSGRKAIVFVRLEGGREVGVSAEHPFFTSGQQWKPIKDLVVGEQVAVPYSYNMSGHIKPSVNEIKRYVLDTLADKPLEEEVFLWERKSLKILFRELFAVNALCLNDKVCISSSNKELLSQLSSLLMRLNIFSFIIKVPNFAMPYILWLERNYKTVQELINSLKASSVTKPSEITYLTIDSIYTDGVEQTYDLEIEGTHNFIGNDIFLHNTLVGPPWLYNEIYKDECEGPYIVGAPSYKILMRATVPTMIDCFKGTDLEGVFKETKGEYVLPNGAKIYCCSTDRSELLEGRQFKAGWLDEAGQMPISVWEVIQGRLAFYQGRCLLTSSPYAVNWLYTHIYRRWEEGDPDYKVVTWKSIDNPYFPQAEWDRAKRTMDPLLFAMKYGGEFHKLSGLIYPTFPDAIVASSNIKPDWPRYGGIDFGFSHPFSVVEGALDDDGRVHIYRERKKPQTLLRDHAGFLNPMISYFGDPAARQEIEELNGYGIIVTSANNAVELGIQKVTEYIKDERLLVSEVDCKNLIDEAAIYKWNKSGDKPVKINDDLVDALRYLIMGINQSAGTEIYLI